MAGMSLIKNKFNTRFAYSQYDDLKLSIHSGVRNIFHTSERKQPERITLHSQNAMEQTPKMQLSDFLSSNFSFTTKELESILSCFRVQKLKKNDYLLRETEVCYSAFFIISGGIKTFVLDEFGNEAVQHVAFENEVTTSLESFITQLPGMNFYRQ